MQDCSNPVHISFLEANLEATVRNAMNYSVALNSSTTKDMMLSAAQNGDQQWWLGLTNMLTLTKEGVTLYLTVSAVTAFNRNCTELTPICPCC